MCSWKHRSWGLLGLLCEQNLWKTSHRSACWAVPYRFSSLADLYLSQVGAADNTLKEIWNVCVLKGGCLGECGGGRRQEEGSSGLRWDIITRTSSTLQKLASPRAASNARKNSLDKVKLYSKLYDHGQAVLKDYIYKRTEGIALMGELRTVCESVLQSKV